MKVFLGCLRLLCLMGCFAGQGFAASLFGGESPAQPLLASHGGQFVPLGATGQDGANARSSLFQGRQGRSLFAPVAIKLDVDPIAALSGARAVPNSFTPGIAGLRDLIAKAEAGPAGYNAVVWSAKIKTPKPPTDMTLGEIFQWIKDTPNQNHAIGRYQFIPKTLGYLVNRLGLHADQRFTPHVQDQLANLLLEDAGFSDFAAGKLSQTAFMNNLAKIWAGLPNSSGKSHYHGKAGNKAVLTWDRFEKEMTRIFAG